MANRAQNSLTADAGASAAVAELLPDPSNLPREPAPGSADDLIASIADQQIDALISESEQLPIDKSMIDSAGAAELAVQATQELQQMAKELSAEATADLVADLNGAATEAMLAAPAIEPETTPPVEVKPPAEATAKAEATPKAEATTKVEAVAQAEVIVEVPSPPPTQTPAPQVDASAAMSSETVAAIPEPDAVVETVVETPPHPTPAPMQSIEAVPAVGPAMTLTPADAEINQDEIDALISIKEPAPAAAPAAASVAAETHEPHMAHAADIARNLESGSEAVAQELAKDAARATASLPPIVIVPMSTKVRLAVSNAAMTVLNLINLPVRNLSDNARELIGIVAIVTLVNAMSMLLYLMIFR